MLLKPQQPFDFHRTLKFILSPPAQLSGRVFEPLMDHYHDGEYRRAIRIDSQPVLYGISEDGNSGPPALKVRVLKGPGDRGVRQQVQRTVARQFATELDLSPFYRIARKDKVLARLVDRFRGLRIPQAPSVYECVVCAILEQQVNLTFAHQVKRALVEAYGKSVEFKGQRYSTFPQPRALARVTPADLRKLQISGPKARYIIEFSRAVSVGELDPEELRKLPSEQVRQRLLRHKGIGPWTAEYVCLRALGKPDHLPASDVGLQKAIQLFYRLRKLPSPAHVEQLARKWAGWRSYATFYLWLTYWEQADWKKSLLEEIYSKKEIKRR
ncbi:MAG: DNA-3-methyladenine glycosylase [Acidobacteriota bacterium]